MSVVEGLAASLAAKFRAVFPHLDERQRRLVMGAEARAIGHGGIALVARAAGVAVVTVSRGGLAVHGVGLQLGPSTGHATRPEVDPGVDASGHR